MLQLSNISFKASGLNGDVEIIDNVSFTLPEGRILVITGPNGGGKSTLARLIMGIAVPTSGKIEWDGQDITNATISQRAALSIGYAFQLPAKFKGVKIRKLLALAAGHDMDEMEACGYLSKVGLCAQDYINRDADGSLSGGELKRVEIATLLARAPKLAIYDEPEAGIDLWSFSMLIETFKNLRQAPNQSIIIISHQERILQLADDIMVLSAGRITAYGPRQQVLPTLGANAEQNCECPVLYSPVEAAKGAN